MRGSEIKVVGNAGAYLGEHLCSGSIRVRDDAGDFQVPSTRKAQSLLAAVHIFQARR